MPVFSISTPAVAATCEMKTSSVVFSPKRIIAGVCRFESAHPSATLDRDPAAGARILQRAFGAGLNRQFLGAEQLSPIDRAVDDPQILVAVAAAVVVADRFQVVALLEMRIDVLVPVQLADDEVQVLMFFLGHVFDQQRPGNVAAFDDRLVHAEHVAAPLRFVGAERTGCVQDAGRNQPAGAPFEAIGPAEIENAVVALVPVFQTASHVFGLACPAPAP